MKSTGTILSLLLSVALVGCGKSEPSENTRVAQDAAGVYECYSVADCAYFHNTVATGDVVTVTATDNAVADIVIESTDWGTATVTGASAVRSGDAVLLTGEGSVEMGMGGNAKAYDCSLTAEIVGSTGVFTITVPAVMGGLTLTFHSGDVPAALVLPGDYSGWVNAVGAYFPQGMAAGGASVAITEKEDGSFAMKADLVDWGAPEFEQLSVERENGRFNISGTGTALLGMGGGTPSEYPVSLSGSMNEDGSDVQLVFHLNIMGGVDITFLEGEAPSAE